MVGSGMLNTPERLKELEERKAKHERLTRGKVTRTFGEIFDEKMGRGKKRQDEEPEEKEAEPEVKVEEEKGAKDPLLGLTPGQKPAIANPSKDRRSAKFIVKG
jgi:hypothetical protein